MQIDFEEEGFFQENIQIRQASALNCKSPPLNSHSQLQKKLFETKVLPWSGFFKQMKEDVENNPRKHTNMNDVQCSERKKNKPTYKDHPYKLYQSNSNYQLIYSRTNDPEPIKNTATFFTNQIKLEHIGNPQFTQYKKIKNFQSNPHKKTQFLSFDSKFECGNLHCAYKHQKNEEYILFISNDTNSLGYNQWFYFSIAGIVGKRKYTLRIVNFKKKNSFFKHGNKPTIFSLAQYQREGQGWSKNCTNVVYQQSPVYIQEYPSNKFYSLSFDISFNDDDFVLISMGLPYSYSKLISFLKQSDEEAKNDKELQFHIQSVSKTICGNDLPEVTITKKSDVKNKPTVAFMARQHPGEVWSSYMMEGVIRKLISSKQDENITWLLKNFVILLYPMINIDGVVYGNFRCDITGVDLNRRWKDSPELLYPQIFKIKKRIKSLQSKTRFCAFFDLHGHSKNYNVFAYSCKDNSYTCRILPFLISKRNSTFYMPSCTFGISKYKETTARAAIYSIIKNENVLTIESSFYGSKINGVVKEFIPMDMFRMAEDIVYATRHFLENKGKAFLEAKKYIQSHIRQFMKYDEVNQFDSGSQSDPERDQIDLEIKIQSIFKSPFVKKQTIFSTSISKSLSPHKKLKGIDLTIQNQMNEGQIENNKKTIKDHFTIKEIPMHKKPLHTLEPRSKRMASNFQRTFKAGDKKTISFIHQNNRFKKKESQSMLQSDKTKKLFRERHRKIGVSHEIVENEKKVGQIKGKKEDILMYKSKNSEEIESELRMLKMEKIEEEKEDKNFIKKFEKFIPFGMKNKQANVNLFQEQLYNEDQSNLISMLLDNKRKIEVEKIKRDVQKLTYIVERQGKIKNANRYEKIVNFRSFKQDEKTDWKIRNRYCQDSFQHF